MRTLSSISVLATLVLSSNLMAAPLAPPQGFSCVEQSDGKTYELKFTLDSTLEVPVQNNSGDIAGYDVQLNVLAHDGNSNELKVLETLPLINDVFCILRSPTAIQCNNEDGSVINPMEAYNGRQHLRGYFLISSELEAISKEKLASVGFTNYSKIDGKVWLGKRYPLASCKAL